jgi:membrane protein YqaA with SNARE-associated domain
MEKTHLNPDPISDPSEIQTRLKNPKKKKFPPKAIHAIRVIVLLALVILTIVLVTNRDRIQTLQAYGYPGIFLLSILSNATILVPVPGVVFTSAMGAIFNPLFVSIAAGTGAAIGELSGYLAGFSGQAIVEKSARYEKVAQWMTKYGDITILVLAFIPNPLFDLAGLLAGILKMPLWKFLVFCMIGKILKMMLFAYTGNWVLDRFWQ